jgi:hypothetical protein
MNAGRVPPPQRVPTLTEVVEFAAPTAPAPGNPDPPLAAATAAVEPRPGQSGGQWTGRVLAPRQPQRDSCYEARLRDALAPLLARSAEALIRDTRAELTATLHAMVSRAVAQELARSRDTPRSEGAARDSGATPD